MRLVILFGIIIYLWIDQPEMNTSTAVMCGLMAAMMIIGAIRDAANEITKHIDDMNEG